jgi:hypothetical protein
LKTQGEQFNAWVHPAMLMKTGNLFYPSGDVDENKGC